MPNHRKAIVRWSFSLAGAVLASCADDEDAVSGDADASEVGAGPTDAGQAEAGTGSPADASAAEAGVNPRPDAAADGPADGGTGAGGQPPTDADTSDGAVAMPECEQVSVGEFVPSAARFAPGAEVTLLARLQTAAAVACEANLHLQLTELGTLRHETSQVAVLNTATETTVSLRWDAPDDDFRGYLAVLSVNGSDPAATAVDVSSTPVRYPRYSFVSSFPPDRTVEATREMIRVLSQHYHFNMFQLYDWFWRHEDLMPRTEQGTIEDGWIDLFGRVNDWSAITDVVQEAHAYNGYALAYVAIYAAREGYEQQSGVEPAWGLFEAPAAKAQVALPFGGERYLFLFDPSNEQWQDHMGSEYVEAVRAANFDGVHIDQFGPRPTLYRADGSPLELNETFAPFLQSIDAALRSGAPGHDVCTFNIVDGLVGGYAVEEVATTSACDFIYSEIWFSNDTYETLRAYIERLRELGGGRAVVLAVYPQYGEDVGVILEAENARLNGVSIADQAAGFSGSGYVQGFDAVGDFVEWNITLDEASLLSLVFTYANAGPGQATRTVLVDGQSLGKLSFPERGELSEWAFDAWLQVREEAGAHSVQLLYAEDDVGTLAVDRLTLGEFDEDAVRLQNAVIFASGATPILVGDDEHALVHEYFPNRSKSLPPSLKRALQSQFTFITAHERLLFAPEVEPIEGRLSRIEALSEQPLIDDGVGGIWTVLRRTPVGEAIHLVNLVGLDNDRWRDAAPTPPLQERIRLRYRTDDVGAVSAVLWASPDEGTGGFSSLPFTVSAEHIEFELPRLSYWVTVLIQRQ